MVVVGGWVVRKVIIVSVHVRYFSFFSFFSLCQTGYVRLRQVTSGYIRLRQFTLEGRDVELDKNVVSRKILTCITFTSHAHAEINVLHGFFMS